MNVRSRFRLGTSYVSLVVAGSLAASAVQAGDAVISSAQTSPAATSRADGSAPGNLTLAPEGSIKVGPGPAVTIDSDHTFTNNGLIEANAEAGAKGIVIAAPASGTLSGALVDNGTITLAGPASSSSLWAEYVANTGIEVSGGTFSGSIIRGANSTLTVGGNGSTGIAILSTLEGTLQNYGAIKLARQESYGIKTLGRVTDSLINGGLIETTGQESVGLYAGGGVDGAIINRGSIVTGAPATTDSAGAAVAAVRGGRALWVAGNTGGILLDGNGLTKEQEAVSLVLEGLPADSLLSVRGAAEALYIGPGGPGGARNITVGALGDDTGTSLLARGNIITESAVRSTTPVRAVNITGANIGGTIYRTTLDAAFRNEGGEISSLARDSVAQGVRIGEYASVPSLSNSGTILARGVDSGESADGVSGAGGGDAYGVIIEQNGSLPELINTGTINADSRGVTQSAWAVIDYSGTLTSLVNEGRLIAARKGTGSATAFDLSRTTRDVTVQNSGSMSGAMLFGAGADTFTSTGGLLLGNVSMGAGNDAVSFADTTMTGILDLGTGAHTVSLAGSTLEGGLTLADGGTATLDMDASTLSIANASTVRITDGHIRGGSTVNFYINALDETVGGIKADGALTIDSGTILNATLSGAVVDQFKVNLIEAGTLTIDADLGGLQPGSTVMYSRAIALAEDNPNILQYQITRRTADQLGLAPILGTIYDRSVAGMGLDSEFAGVMAAYTDQAKFEAALAEMVPDTSDAARRVALNARALSDSAIQRRLSGFPSNRNDPLGRFRSGFWLQHLTTFGSADGAGEVPGFSTFSMGVAAGMDAEIDDQSIVGISLTQIFGSAEEKNRATDKVKLSTTALDFYARTNTDFGYIQGVLGYGFNSYSAGRTVKFDSIERETDGSSPGYQWGGTLDMGSPVVLGATTLTAFLRASYANIYRHAFEEENGGPAVDLRYDSRSHTSIRTGGGAIAEHRLQLGPASSLALNAHVDYAHEFNRTPTDLTARFVYGDGTAFTLGGLKPAAHIFRGGVGGAWERRLSALSVDYDAEKAGSYLGHSLTVTYRQRF